MSSATASRLINTQSTTEPTSRNDRSGCGQERQPARYRLTLDAQQAIQARAPEGAEPSDFATNDLPNTTQISVSAGNRLERIVGVVVHRVLELAASEDSLSAQDPKVPLWIEHNLSQYALTSQALSEAKIRASDLAERALSCETGRWILGAQTEAQSELAISRVEAGEVKNYVIDRTFLDDQEGVRWIIDYKTSEPTAGETLTTLRPENVRRIENSSKNILS